MGTIHSIYITLTLVIISTALFFLWGKNGKISVGSGSGLGQSSYTNKKPTLIISGPSNSGKTTLFGLLTTDTLKTTVVSQTPSVCSDYVKDSQSKSVKLIEFPGNIKLAHELLDTLRSSNNIKGILFLVDATVDPKSITQTAELLYDILNIVEGKEHNGVNILVACNKSESFIARPPQRIMTALEEEIAKILKRKRQSLGSVNAGTAGTSESNLDDDDDLLNNETALDSITDFKFSLLESEITVADGSVLKKKISKWEEWIDKAVNQ